MVMFRPRRCTSKVKNVAAGNGSTMSIARTRPVFQIKVTTWVIFASFASRHKPFPALGQYFAGGGWFGHGIHGGCVLIGDLVPNVFVIQKWYCTS